ncbi:MAG: phage minor head protein [Hyphomicrobiaceae bacterium]
MAETIQYRTAPSPEVLAYFRNKGQTLSFDWRDVWPQEHAHAFTVAKATQIEVLNTIREAVDDALARGVPFEQFRAGLEPRLKALGWWGKQLMGDPATGQVELVQLGSPHRLRIIYDANIRTANAAGLWERIWRTREMLPFLIYMETTSVEPRDEHLIWARTPIVLRVDDPWWETHFPPNGWQCKCWVLQVDEEDARAAGWTPDTQAPELDAQDWTNKRTGDVMSVPAGIDPGWQTNPGLTRQMLLEEYLAGRLNGLDGDLKAVVQNDMTSNWLFKKMADGEFYKFGEGLGTQFAAPVGVASSQVAAAAGLKNGVVWLTPDMAFALGQNQHTAADWLKATKAIDEGAVIRAKSKGDKPDPRRFSGLRATPNPDHFEVYRELSGQYYKITLEVRDRTMNMQPVPGGERLVITGFAKVPKKIAELEINVARNAGTLVKEEQGSTAAPTPANPKFLPGNPANLQPQIGPPEQADPLALTGPGANPKYQPDTGTGEPPAQPTIEPPATAPKYQPQIGPDPAQQGSILGPGGTPQFQPFTGPEPGSKTPSLTGPGANPKYQPDTGPAPKPPKPPKKGLFGRSKNTPETPRKGRSKTLQTTR